MTIALITGATGQDGSYLVDRLLANGATVHAIIRGETAQEETTLPPLVIPHVSDLSDLPALRHIVLDVSPDLLVNLGGLSSVAASWQEPALTAQVTGLAAVELMDAALESSERRGSGVRFVQASSAEIYGLADEVPQNESTPLAPVSPYGIAKAMAHQMVAVYRERGLPASAAVLYNHESPRRPTTFVTRKITHGVARIALGLDERIVLGNLDAERDWGWAPDYVDGLLRIAAADPDDFVLATGQAHSVRDFVMAAFRAVGISDGESRVDVDPRFLRPSDAPLLIGDATRAREHLGWAPTRTFEELVAEMVGADLERLGAE